jgi:hypothetical protein
MKNRIIIEYKIKWQKMIKISRTIKIETNLETVEVIDSLFMGPSLLENKNCWASLLGNFFPQDLTCVLFKFCMSINENSFLINL